MGCPPFGVNSSVEDKQIGCEEAPEHSLRGVVGPGLVDEPEARIATHEDDTAARTAGRMAQGAGEEGLAHDARRSEEENGLVALQEAEAGEIVDPVAVDGDGGIPVEVLEGVGLVEAGAVELGGEVLALAPVDLFL
jgi:hypothetical protein